MSQLGDKGQRPAREGQNVPKQHLKMLGRLALPGGHDCVLRGNLVYVGPRYGAVHTLSIVDVSRPEKPVLASSVEFKGGIPSLALKGDVLFATEWKRALNLVDVRDPAKPDYFDCVVAFRQSIRNLHVAGNLLLGATEEGVALYDVIDPRTPKALPRILPERDITWMSVRAEDLYLGVRGAGLHVYSIRDGRIEPRARHFESGFEVDEIHVLARHLVLIGQSLAAGDDSDYLLVDRGDPSTVIFRGTTQGAPKSLGQTTDGGAIGFSGHYTCVSVPATASKPQPLFSQYLADGGSRYVELAPGASSIESLMHMDDISWFARRGTHLYCMQGRELVVYAIQRGSPLGTLVEAPA